MTPPLPEGFLARPIAHRALHGPARPENSAEALRAAAEAGWGIEIDLQLSADGEPMVFHDATLDRMTAETGPLRARTAAELSALPLTGGAEGMPTFVRALEIVGGRVPLLVELKDQSQGLDLTDGALERAAAAAALGYDGPLAFMSFNPHAVLWCAQVAPRIPRGLTTTDFRPEDWPGIAPARLAHLREMADLTAAGAAFVSHDRRDLANPKLAEIRAAGLPILTWTIRSHAEAQEALRIADQITFEGYTPPSA